MEEEQKEITYAKYRDYSLYIFLIALVIVYFAGQEVFKSASLEFGSLTWVFGIVGLIVSFILNTIIYEVSKLIGGKISKYHLVYINLFGFCFYKDKDNKTRFKLVLMENYGGNTVMAPNDKDGSGTKPVLYHSLGSILTISLNVIAVIIFVVINATTYNVIPLLCALLSLIMGGIYVILNIVPLYSDDLLDGYTLRLLLNPALKEVYFNYLYNEEAYYNHSHEFAKYNLTNLNNVLATDDALYQYYYYVVKEDYVNAEKIIDAILESKDYCFPYIYKEAFGDKYYFKLLHENNEKVKEEYYKEKKDLQRTLVSSFDFAKLKSTLLFAALIEESYDYYEYLESKADKMYNRYSVDILREGENKLVELSFKRIKEVKKEWFIPYDDSQVEPNEEDFK